MIFTCEKNMMNYSLENIKFLLHNSKEIADVKYNAPLFVVKGNDKECAENLPTSLDFELCGLKFFLTHNRKYIL